MDTACHSFNFLISRRGGDEGEERGGKDGSDNFLMGRKKEAEQPFFDLKMAIFMPRNPCSFPGNFEKVPWDIFQEIKGGGGVGGSDNFQPF